MRNALVATLTLMFVLVGHAVAARPASTLDGFRDANARLALAVVSAEDERLPRLSDPDSAPLLRAAFDTRVLSLVDWSDMELALDVCTLGRDFLDTYRTADPVRYQDEFALATGFALRCMAHAMPALGRFWEALPSSERTKVRLEGLRQMRRGVAQMYLGVLRWQAASVVGPATRNMLLTALLDSNPGLGGIMAPADRKAVAAALAEALSTASPEARASLTHLQEELAALPCVGLCAA